ncbi:hypothetical protein ACB092_12G141100 [Castanea dentata]
MFDKGFVYRCNSNECNFQLDRECAFMRPVKEKEEDEKGQEKLIHRHPYHDHPLLLLEKVHDEHFKCIICLKYCSDAHSTYGCIPCRLFLHEGSCLETKFPPQLQHFYHSHPLTLSLTQSDRDIQCKACYSWGRNIWYYSCKQCDNFVMDIACALLPTTIKSEIRFSISSTDILCHLIISSLKGENGDVELRSTLGHSGKLICKNKAKEMVQKKE